MPNLLYPIEWVVAAIMVSFHQLLEAVGLPAESGWTWALSIVGLVLVIRVLMIPLFFKQIHSMRRMQMVAPELRKVQQKYKGKKDQASIQAQQAETMEIYRQAGTNPFASCLPLLVQMPIFFGLFRVLNGVDEIARGDRAPIGLLTQELSRQFDGATIFGAPLSATFLHDDLFAAKAVSLVLIITMTISTYVTQKQMMTKNMPAASQEGPIAQQQKIMLYLIPGIMAVSGVNFPVGVLIYWTVTNLWSFAQQMYVIHRMPTPGTPAEERMHARQLAKGKQVTRMENPFAGGDDETGESPSPGGATVVGAGAPARAVVGGGGGQRPQPVGKKRSKKRKKK